MSLSLEDAVHRLVNVIGAMENNAAIAEIIRQRDKALSELASTRSSKEMYVKWYEEKRAENYRLGRVISSLRGVITRMKKARRT